MEKKLGNDPVALSRYYQPVVQGPARSSAAASSETTTAGPAQGGANAGAAAPGTPGAPGAPGANIAGIAVMGQAPGMVAGMPPGAPNINFNMGGPKPP